MTCILCDGTDVSVLLVYKGNRADLKCKVQMEFWDGSVLDTNATCPDFGQKYLQLPGMLTLSDCDTTSLPLWQRKCHCTEDNMISGNYSGVTTLGDVGTTHTELMNAAMPFFVALYGQPPGTSMESAR